MFAPGAPCIESPLSPGLIWLGPPPPFKVSSGGPQDTGIPEQGLSVPARLEDTLPVLCKLSHLVHGTAPRSGPAPREPPYSACSSTVWSPSLCHQDAFLVPSTTPHDCAVSDLDPVQACSSLPFRALGGSSCRTYFSLSSPRQVHLSVVDQHDVDVLLLSKIADSVVLLSSCGLFSLFSP